MGHMLEQYEDMASFASLRQPAWHGLGTVFDEAVNTSEMLDLAHLSNWDVRQEAIDLPGRYHGGDFFANVRTNPFDGETDVLGVVGSRYRVFQNEELFSFGDNILDGGGTWETAGSIKNGTVVFGALSLNREITVNGETTDNYLLVSSSHDGSHPIQASVTPIRVVCNNTLTFAIGKGGKSAKQSFRIRHTQTTDGRVAEARQALGVAHAYLDAFEDEMKELINVSVNDKKFHDIITTAYPKPEATNIKKGEILKGGAMASQTRWESKLDTLKDIWASETTPEKNAWTALNAMTERLDWHRQSRNGSFEGALVSASGFDPATNVEKNRLRKITRELVGLTK